MTGAYRTLVWVPHVCVTCLVCVICLVCVGVGGRAGMCVCSRAPSATTAATVLERGECFLAVPVGGGTDDCCAAGGGDDAYRVAGVCLSPWGLNCCCSCC